MFKFLSKLFSPYGGVNKTDHPIHFLKERFNTSSISFKFIGYSRGDFSAYSYQAGSYELLGSIPSNKLDIKVFDLLRSSKFRELGISNKVLIDKNLTMFLPMIDFVGLPSIYDFEIFANQLGMAVPSLKGESLVCFFSGNSYHGYVCKLLSTAEQDDFIFFLKGADFVDQKWLDMERSILRLSKTWSRPAPKFTYEVLI